MIATHTYSRSSVPPADCEVTPEDLYHNPQWGRCELVNGKVILMSPAGHRHGRIAMELAALIAGFVKNHKLGVTYAAETGFVFPNGKTVRAPDVMFLSASRLPADLPEEGFLPLAPDFAAEVVSPDDKFSEVVDKAESYLAAGVKLVWVVDPAKKRIHVYRPNQPVDRVLPGQKLNGEAVLPGFEIAVDALFE